MYPDALLIMVGYASSSVSAAAFGIAVRYIRLARFVPVSFLHVREPALAQMWTRGDTQNLASEVRAIAATSFAVSAGILLPLMLFAPAFMNIFGSTFAEFTTILRLVVLAEIVNSLALMPASLLLIGRHFRTLAAINLSVYLGGLLISGFAINAFGGEGAAIALVGTNLILALVTSAYCFKIVGIRADAVSSYTALIINRVSS
jgi:O-antigen/teichoic acid export membrane protein